MTPDRLPTNLQAQTSVLPPFRHIDSTRLFQLVGLQVRTAPVEEPEAAPPVPGTARTQRSCTAAARTSTAAAAATAAAASC